MQNVLLKSRGKIKNESCTFKLVHMTIFIEFIEIIFLLNIPEKMKYSKIRKKKMLQTYDIHRLS